MAVRDLRRAHDTLRHLAAWRRADEVAARYRNEALTERVMTRDDRLDAFLERIDEIRLALFRRHVAASVVRVSPLALRACAMVGCDIDDVASRLTHELPWVDWLCGPTLPPILRKSATTMIADLRFHLDRFAHGGLIVRPPSPGRFGLGVRVYRRGLEMGAVLGEAWLRTHGTTGSLTIAGELPEIVAASIIGRDLAELASHPLIDGAGLRVLGLGRAAGRGSVIMFRCPPVRWRAPWSRPGGRV